MEEPQETSFNLPSSIHFFRKYFSTNNRTHILQEKQFLFEYCFLIPGEMWHCVSKGPYCLHSLTPWPLKMKAWLSFVMLGTTNPVIQHHIKKIWISLCKLFVDKTLFWKWSLILLDQVQWFREFFCLHNLEVLLSFPNVRGNKDSVRWHYLCGDFVIFLNIQGHTLIFFCDTIACDQEEEIYLSCTHVLVNHKGFSLILQD